MLRDCVVFPCTLLTHGAGGTTAEQVVHSKRGERAGHYATERTLHEADNHTPSKVLVAPCRRSYVFAVSDNSSADHYTERLLEMKRQHENSIVVPGLLPTADVATEICRFCC